MAATNGGVNDRNNRVGCCAEDDLHVDGQGSEDVLLRKTEKWKVALQTYGQNTRQVLLQGNVGGREAKRR